MRVIEYEDGQAPVYECGVCNGPLLLVHPPLLPSGYTAGTWQGWFHLDDDAACRHFGNVGWRRLDHSPPTVVRS